MKAIVIEKAGPPEVLEIKEWPTPEPKPGWVLIRVRAFGLNRSELFTRQGHSPSVKFPRVLGIECVGEVEAAPGGELEPGQKCAAVMGNMGREYDGGYAEYALIPAAHVLPVTTDLDWPTFAAVPESFLTAWGALVDTLDVQPGQTLLVRGGTSSVGMAAITIAKDRGLTVAATTRNAAKADALRANGADHVVIDDGAIAGRVREIVPDGVDQVLELVGAVTLRDSFRAAKAPKGAVCFAGILGNSWVVERFEPLVYMSSGQILTTYGTHVLNRDNATAPLQQILAAVAAGRYRVNLDRVFPFGEIVAAHRYMEENRATGKVVVTVEG